MPADELRRMVAEIRRLAETLPSRIPTTLRCGRIVREMLSAGSKPASPASFGSALFGVTVLSHDGYGPGEWRLFDQWDEPLHEGHLWPADLPVHESDLLPDGVHALVYTPPPGADLGPPGPCVIVRAASEPTDA